MTKVTKPSKRLKIARVLAAITTLPFILFGLFIAGLSLLAFFDNDSMSSYDHAKQTCQSELWMLVNDSPWSHVQQVEEPYPSEEPRNVISYACSEQGARQKQENSENVRGKAFFLVVGAFYLFPVAVIAVVWWVVEEISYLRTSKADIVL